MPQWQRILGQGSRAVRSLCHTSLQAGRGQPSAQLGVLKTQGNAANLQGCLPWLFSNGICLTAFVRLCLAAVWWSGGCGGYSQTNQTTWWALLLPHWRGGAIRWAHYVSFHASKSWEAQARTHEHNVQVSRNTQISLFKYNPALSNFPVCLLQLVFSFLFTAVTISIIDYFLD